MKGKHPQEELTSVLVEGFHAEVIALEPPFVEGARCLVRLKDKLGDKE